MRQGCSGIAPTSCCVLASGHARCAGLRTARDVYRGAADGQQTSRAASPSQAESTRRAPENRRSVVQPLECHGPNLDDNAKARGAAMKDGSLWSRADANERKSPQREQRRNQQTAWEPPPTSRLRPLASRDGEEGVERAAHGQQTSRAASRSHVESTWRPPKDRMNSRPACASSCTSRPLK